MALRTWVVVLAAVAVTLTCSGPPETPPAPTLSLSARPTAIDDRGENSLITVRALTAEGSPGSGSVELSSSAGSLTSGVTLTLRGDGTAEAMFSCTLASDMSCSGRVTLTATWGVAMATTRVQVGDAGVPGTAGGSGTAGGATAGGSSGGTATAGGATAGGAAGGTATAGGAATAGGSTTDAGDPDAGDPDAGPSDGGSDGGADAGFDAGTFVFEYDAGRGGNVFLLGLLQPMSDSWGLAPLASPSQPEIGYQGSLFPNEAVIRPGGGTVYYDALNQFLREQQPDAYEALDGGGSRYPLNPEFNDIIVSTSMCSPTARVSGFWVWPDTAQVVYRCGTMNQYFENGVELVRFSGLTLYALGFAGTALAGTSAGMDVLVEANGTMRTLTGLGGQTLSPRFNALSRQRQIRAYPGGFRLVLGSGMNDSPPCHLWQINSAAAASVVDVFTGPPTGVLLMEPCNGRLDLSGALYTPGFSGSTDVIVRHSRAQPDGGPSSSSIAYTEQGAAPSSFASFPPTVFTFIEGGAYPVCGP